MKIGHTIRQCRKAKNLTQAQLASAAGLSIPYICLLEKNDREPKLSTMQLISEALEIPLSVLIFLAAEGKDVPELNVEHVESLSRNIMDLMAHAK